ncbi:hypothetical protein PG994_013197 [Apiospora phragmitis]|uniref:Major facilitator superfamily (MFS) profile domain-containing protein n=1 Tax=Apiospora phragmitis TaxID=2905665 RepID=A0ABR1T7Y5_9PEZI
MAGGVVVTGTTDVNRVEAPVTWKAYMICAFAAFSGIFFGYDTGWMSGVMAMPYFINLYTGMEYDYVNKVPIGSLFTSILSCGTFFGALMGGDIADFIGRRPTIIMGCAVFCVGCTLQIASTNQEGLFVLGRLVAGAGVGFISAVVILYMSEIAPKKVRGAMVSGYQFCITIGILVAACVVYGTQERSDTSSYRIPIGIQYLWAISPRYFVRKGETEKAAKALAFLRGQPIESAFVKDELAEIVANNEYEMQVIPQTNYIGSWLACFKGSLSAGDNPLRRTLLGTGMQMFQQLTGINFVFYFGTPFFTQLGTIDNPFLISMITTLVNVLSTPISFYAVEKFGRRALLIYGACSMIVCQFIVAIIGVTAGKDRHICLDAFICLNVSSFAITWGPAAWVIVGEAFPVPIRSRGVGVSTASNWLWNTIIDVITPYLVGKDKADLGTKVFFLWGALCCGSLLFGISLEQADMYMAEASPRKSAAWRPSHTFAAEMGVAGEKLAANTTVKEETV